MQKQTLDQLDSLIAAVRNDLTPRVAELAEKNTEGLLTPDELREYTEAVRLSDTLSLLKLQAEEFWAVRVVL